MKCEEAQCRILLEEAGELPSLEAAELNAHLSSCAACREYRNNAIKIVSCARKNLPADGPGGAVLTRIRAAAGEQASGRVVELRFVAVRILAYAAAITVLVGGWFVLSSRQQTLGRINSSIMTANTRSEQIGHINRIVAALSKEGYLMDVDEQQNDSTKEPDIRELARQLLIMEGLTAEEGAEDEVTAPDVELLPTDLRSSNSSGLSWKECV